MARIDDDGTAVGADLYGELREREETRYARRGRLVLVREGVKVDHTRPPPLLAALRAGEPVVIPDWKLPDWARGRVENKQVRVHPDGRVADVEPQR